MTAETLNIHEVEIEMLGSLLEDGLQIAEEMAVWIAIEPELQIGGEIGRQIVDDQCRHIDCEPADHL
jgi:hypothetical protein